MIKFTEFQENFEIIEINFDFKYPTKLMMMIYEKCKHISTDDLNKAVSKILTMNAEGWSKICGFGKKSPPLAEWINLFAGIKEPSPELKAALEVARILDYASYYYGNSVWFDNPTTNACVETYGGIGKIAWIIDSTNDDKESRKYLPKQRLTVMDLNEVKQYIKDNRLNTKNRKRPQVYQRAFLSAYLYDNGVTLEEIGRLFNRHHATIMHSISLHTDLTSYKDDLYCDLTARLSHKTNTNKHITDEDQGLRYRILQASTKPEFNRIKDLVKNNLI